MEAGAAQGRGCSARGRPRAAKEGGRRLWTEAAARAGAGQAGDTGPPGPAETLAITRLGVGRQLRRDLKRFSLTFPSAAL